MEYRSSKFSAPSEERVENIVSVHRAPHLLYCRALEPKLRTVNMAQLEKAPDSNQIPSFQNLEDFIAIAKAVGISRLRGPASRDLYSGFSMASRFFDASKGVNASINRDIDAYQRKINIGVDGITLPLEKHRQLGGLNENAYSDWFAWCLEVAQVDKIMLGELMTTLFPIREPVQSAVPEGPADIIREIPVEQGHQDQSGRLDIVVNFNEADWVWHIEVKVTSAESADLGKNKGYAESLRSLYPGKNIRNFLLVTHAQNAFYGDGEDAFSVVTWKQLCQRIREWIQTGKHARFSDYQFMMFCGLVEHHLLNITPGGLSHLRYLEEIYK